MRALGVFIAAKRKERGLRSIDLAEQTGIPATWIRGLENGRINTMPPPERVKALAAALGVPVRDLLVAAGYLEQDE
jgi:transcriptional regulator with XRE-family HTH domain